MKKITIPIDKNFRPTNLEKEKKIAQFFGSEYLNYRKKWNEVPLNRTITKVPLHIDIEATSNCNLKCTMCPRTVFINANSFWKVENFDLEKFKNIIIEAGSKGTTALKLQYLGEPLMNRDIFDMIKFAKENSFIDVMFNTNATNLTKDKSIKLLESGIDKISFSFDSPYKEEYEKIRVNGNYDKALNNILNFCKLKKELGYEKPITRVQMVDLNHNASSFDDFNKLFVDHVDTVAKLDEMDHMDDVVFTGDQDKFWEDIISESSKVDLNEPVEVVSEDSPGYEDSKYCCPQLWQRMFIHPDGVVTPCCLDSGRYLRMGNIFDSSVEEIWNNKRYKALRKLHQTGNFDKINRCKNCPLSKVKN